MKPIIPVVVETTIPVDNGIKYSVYVGIKCN